MPIISKETNSSFSEQHLSQSERASLTNFLWGVPNDPKKDLARFTHILGLNWPRISNCPPHPTIILMILQTEVISCETPGIQYASMRDSPI